jgi:non-ribosomal peptide synthetase component F/aryl carrier-like protein
MSATPVEVTYPASPFQRAALAYPSRPVALIVDTPLKPELLVQRAVQVLGEAPELTVALRAAQASLVPRQVPCAVESARVQDGSWELRAGCLSMRVRSHGGGARLSIDTDGVSADATALESFCHHLAGERALPAGPSFLAVATEHTDMLHEGELDQEKAYWRAVVMATDPCPALGCAPGTEVARNWAERRIPSARLSAFAAECGVNPGEVAYLALRCLLDRVCEGAPTLGILFDTRDLMSLQGVGGLLTQVLPDGDVIDPDMTARALLRRQVERRSKHAEMAGAPALAERESLPTLVFDPRADWQLPPQWHLVEAFEGRSGALTLRLLRQGEDLVLVAQECDGCGQERLDGLLAAWAVVLDALVSDPGAPWRSLRLADPHDPPPPKVRAEAEDIVDRLARFARESASDVAVRQGGRVMSRAGLMERVFDLAGAIGPLQDDAVVAVLAGPQPDLLAAWLAVLWRGAAFLPLLPSEPSQRIEHALASSRASVLLLASGSPPQNVPPGCQVVRMDDIAPGFGRPVPAAAVRAGQTGYLLRTSGTSGVPKLVQIRRDSLNNYLRWVAEEVLADDCEMPVVSSPIFDASFKQILGPVYAGRSTWLLEADPVDAMQAHAELCKARCPLVLNCTPTYWAELLDTSLQGGPELPLRQLLLGGEQISDTLRQRTVTAFPRAEIWNLYGPTETTATATFGRLEPGEPVHAGKPLAGAVVTVADRYARALPRGMRGEVWISGPGVGKGYLGAEDAGPFTGLKLGDATWPSYRTGDSGHVDHKGRLCLAGRRDSQLKLRGWRIEPQEIEVVAHGAPGVVNAKVLLDTTGESHRLCLFFTGEAEESAVATALRERLPAAMVPAPVIKLSRFPRTVTGKLDDRALLDLAAQPPADPACEYDPLQLEVASLWRGLVGQRWPRLDEDFFSAGGHSLLLARLVNQLRARGHPLSLRQIVRHPTVNSMVNAIRTAGRHFNA